MISYVNSIRSSSEERFFRPPVHETRRMPSRSISLYEAALAQSH